MALTFNGTSDEAQVTSSPITGLPCTLHAWAIPTATTGDNTIFGFSNSTDNDPIVRLIKYANGKTTLDWRDDNTNLVQLAGATTLSTSAWNHCLGTFDLSAGLEVFLNGVSDGTNALTTNNPTLNVSNIGVLLLGAAGDIQRFSGDIGQVAAWSVVLNAAEITALSKGAHPLTIRPASLKVCVDLIGGRLIDWLKTGFILTGTTNSANHPRSFLPAGSKYARAAAATGFTGTGAFTLPSLTFSAAGTFPYQGSGAFTLPSLTTSAAGTLTFTGTSGFTLPSLTTAATATLTFTGTSGFTLPSLTTDASGSFTEAGAFTGTGAFTLPALSTAAAGTLTFTGTSGFVLPSLNFAAAGWTTVTGTAAFTLPSLRFSAVAETDVEESAVGGGWVPRHQEYRKGERRERGLEWSTRDRRFVRRSLERAYAKMLGEEPATPEQAAERQVAAEIVRPFIAGSYDTPLPPRQAVDWAALMRNADAARQLLALYSKERLDLDIRRRVAAILLLSV